MKIGDKVYVKNWGRHYSDVYRWVDGKKVSIWGWETKIPDYSSIDFFINRKYTPKLTRKGLPYKNGEKVLVSNVPDYKNYEYTILEEKQYPGENRIVFLLASKNGCYAQIDNFGISYMTPEQQQTVKHLENEKRLQALAVDNLGKWDINVKKKEFPKELLKYLYDSNQNSQFGNVMTKATIKYPYIAKEYTINGNDLCLGWEQSFDGGSSLKEKEVITWDELKNRFPENKFQ